MRVYSWILIKVLVFGEQEERKSKASKAAGLGCREQKRGWVGLGRVEDLKRRHRAKGLRQERTRLPTFSPCTHLLQTDITPSTTWRGKRKLGKERRVRAAERRQCHRFSHWRTSVCVYCQGKHNVASLYTAGELINAFHPPVDVCFKQESNESGKLCEEAAASLPQIIVVLPIQ